MSVPPLTTLPDIHVDTPGLRDGARTLREKSTQVREHLDDAHSSWRGLRSAYQHNATQERVWTGLALLDDPVDAWRHALDRAADLLNDFAGQCDGVLFQHRSLEILRPTVADERAVALASEDPARIASASRSVEYFNGEVADLERTWVEVQADFAAALRAVTGGEKDDLPETREIAEPGRGVLTGLTASLTTERQAADPELAAKLVANKLPEHPAPGSAEAARAALMRLAASLATERQVADPESIAEELKGKDADDLRKWLDSHPELAEKLVDNKLPEHPAPGSAEAVMKTAIDAHDPRHSRRGVDEVAGAWESLTTEDRQRLLLTYPNVFGNLNGVSLEERATVNEITVAGLRHKVGQRLKKYEDEPNWGQLYPGPGGQVKAQSEKRKWHAERLRLESQKKGIDSAWDAYKKDRSRNPRSKRTRGDEYRVVSISLEGEGQIATMRGHVSPETKNIVAFTPGTHTDMESVKDYNNKINAMGEGREGTVEIYWADGQFPGKTDPLTGEDTFTSLVADNATPHFAERDAKTQAAFDQALDREAVNATQTWVAHSAGASKQGTAEREGLTADKVLYMAPAGTGHEVGSLADVASPEADRALIQSRTDMIDVAQDHGGAANSGSYFSGGHPDQLMGAIRLEGGLMEDNSKVQDQDDGGHNATLKGGSTSQENATAFIYGEPVIPYLGDNDLFSDALDRQGIDTQDDFESKKVAYDEVFHT